MKKYISSSKGVRVEEYRGHPIYEDQNTFDFYIYTRDKGEGRVNFPTIDEAYEYIDDFEDISIDWLEEFNNYISSYKKNIHRHYNDIADRWEYTRKSQLESCLNAFKNSDSRFLNCPLKIHSRKISVGSHNYETFYYVSI